MATAYWQLPIFSRWQMKNSNSTIVGKKMYRYISKRWAKSTNNIINTYFLLLAQIIVSISSQFTVSDSIQLFTLKFKAVHPLFQNNQYRAFECSANHSAAYIQEQLHVLVSKDRQHNVPKQYKNAIHTDWTYSIAFTVWDHNSLQSLVIQQLAVTELFCRAQWDVYW
jgi:hypothetical protein